MPLPDSAHRTPLHTREVRCLGFQNADGLWEIEAHLLDTKPIWFPNHEKDGIQPGEPVHRMSLRLTLDIDFLIHKVDVAMDETPYQLCRDVEQRFSQLVGIRIGAGWLREVRQRMPRTVSCTHLYELLTPIATTAYQSMHLALEARAEQLPERQKPPIVDQCYSLASHRNVVKVKWPDFHQPKNSALD